MLRRRKREPAPPGRDEVVDRVLCIAVAAMLAAVVANRREGALADEQASQYVTESHRWLRAENLVDTLSTRERALIAQPLDDWSERDLSDANWRNESLGVLLWALSAVEEMPPYDTPFDRLPELVPLLKATADFRRSAVLRPADELRRARDLAELWHWRARTKKLRVPADHPAAGVDLDEVVTQAAARASAEGEIPATVDGDFPAYGKAYRDLDAEEFATVTSIAVERHHALNWLCGYAADWDKVPTDT